MVAPPERRGIGGVMGESIGEATARFFAEVMPAVVGTRRRNGSVHLVTAWFEFRDGEFWLNSWRGARWLEQVERDGVATLLLVDPADMNRVAEVEAHLIETTEAGADDHIHRLSYRYTGGPYGDLTGQRRVTIRLEPVRVRSSLDWQPAAG
jgi:hypothetical protein